MDKALEFQPGQVQGYDGSNGSKNTTMMSAPTELREVGDDNNDNATFTKSSVTNTQSAYASPPPMREIGNAGLVRPTDGLGFESDIVDCPNCRKRRETVVKRVPSEYTRYVIIYLEITRARALILSNSKTMISGVSGGKMGFADDEFRQAKFSYAMGSFGLCYLVPDCMQMGYNTEHRCSGCQWKMAVIEHDQRPGNVPYVQSQYSMEA